MAFSGVEQLFDMNIFFRVLVVDMFASELLYSNLTVVSYLFCWIDLMFSMHFNETKRTIRSIRTLCNRGIYTSSMMFQRHLGF